jgi:hypothetical protein
MRRPIRAITARPPTTPPTMAPIGGLEAVEGAGVGSMLELDVVLGAVGKSVGAGVDVAVVEVEVVELWAAAVEIVVDVVGSKSSE